MIDRDHKLSITRQASLLNISRGTVYYRLAAKTENQARPQTYFRIKAMTAHPIQFI